MREPRVPEGYVEIRSGRDRILLLEDLREGLRNVDLGDLDRLRERAVEGVYPGRSRHFSCEMGGIRMVVKESRRGGLRARLLPDLYFGAGRFRREVRVTREAGRRGLPVAPIVASVTRPVGLGFCRHHYLVRWMEGTVDLREALRQVSPLSGDTFGERRPIVRSVAEGVRALHDLGICHADLNLGNILLRPEGVGSPPEVIFIDFDTSRLTSRVPFRRRMGNLLRLYRSLLKSCLPGGGVTRTDLARFTRAYSQGDPGPSRRAWQALRRGGPALFLHRLLWPGRRGSVGSP